MATILLRKPTTPGTTPLPLPAPGVARLAEPLWSPGGFSDTPAHVAGSNDLVVHNGTVFVPLVSPRRQVEVSGAQTVGGSKTFTDPLNMAAGSIGVNLLAGTDLFVMGAANGANFVAPTQVNTAFGTWATQNIGFGIDDTVSPPRLRWKANGIDLGVIASGVVGGGDFLPLTGGIMTGPITVSELNSETAMTIGPLTTGALDGRDLSLAGGDSDTGVGGGVTIRGGVTTGAGTAAAQGSISIGSPLNPGTAPNRSGSFITVRGGTAVGNGTAGAVSVYGGAGGTVAPGGRVSLTAGYGGTTSGSGGDVVLVSGNATGGTAGNIQFTLGTSPAGGGLFVINGLPTVAQPGTAVWNNNGVLNIGAGATTPSPLVFAGSYDVAADMTDPVVGAGTALPVASAALNGKFFICTTAGPGLGNATAEGPYAIDDWLICGESPTTAGTFGWHKLAAGTTTATTAANVSITPIPGITATNVQAALAEIEGTKAEFFDAATFGGDGLTAATPKTLVLVDGGTF